jgi:signal transduction histidine kinase
LSEADLAVGVPHVRPVSLRAVVGEVLRRAEVSDNAGNEIDAGLWVIADLPLLTEAFGQLVDNAIRHGRPPVRARAEARSGEVVVTVSDAGAGIPPERLPQLFAGLSALPPDDGRPVRLSGLGRARRLAEAMGGRIWYEHSEGETRLRLVLVPAQAPTGAVAAP